MTAKSKVVLLRIALLAVLFLAAALLVWGLIGGRTGALGGAIAALAAASVSLFGAEKRARNGEPVLASRRRLAMVLGVGVVAALLGAALVFLMHRHSA